MAYNGSNSQYVPPHLRGLVPMMAMGMGSGGPLPAGALPMQPAGYMGGPQMPMAGGPPMPYQGGGYQSGRGYGGGAPR